MELHTLTVAQIANGLRNKEFSASEVVSTHLNRIAEFDNEIGAFLTVADGALEEAERADKRISELGEEGFKEYPLLGIPIAHKDLYLTEGTRTTAGSKVLQDYIPPYSATVVERLRNAGAITLGKLNCDAWAHGSSGENSDFFPTKNPWNKDYVPGGSSSGSAAAVASGFVPAATGTDTGGSIRLPASFCGVTGIKPTYGLVSRYGVVAMASSLDSMGFLARTVEDAALLLKLAAGKDENDATSLYVDIPDYSACLRRPPFGSEPQGRRLEQGLRIGLPKEYFSQGLDSGVKKAVEDAVNEFERLGAQIKEVSLPHTEYAIPIYYIIMSSEVSSNLARYDGVRYGNPRDIFGSEAKRRIMLGTHALSSGYKDKYYGQATQVRELIIKDFTDAFEQVDLLLAPVSPTPPFRLGEKAQDPLQMYLSDILTAAPSLAGLPALSLPCGFTFEGNLPIGMQIIGPKLSEEMLFRAGHAYQEATEWHKIRPKL